MKKIYEKPDAEFINLNTKESITDFAGTPIAEDPSLGEDFGATPGTSAGLPGWV